MLFLIDKKAFTAPETLSVSASMPVKDFITSKATGNNVPTTSVPFLKIPFALPAFARYDSIKTCLDTSSTDLTPYNDI